MREQRKAENNTRTHTTLYSVVFEWMLTKYAVSILLLFFLLQPTMQIFAFEVENGTEGGEEVVLVQPQQEMHVEDQEVEILSVNESAANDEVQQTDTTETDDQENLPDDLVIATPAAIDDLQVPSDDIQSADVTESDESSLEITDISPLATTTATSSETDIDAGTVIPDSDQEEDIQEEVPDISTETILAETATTTATSSEDSQEVVSEHNSHAYQFNTEECALVGDGAYYCSTPTQDDVIQDGVFSKQDKDGDLEIFIRLDGVEQQITSNTVDDIAPYYDAISKRIVWHTSIEDRYQIASYDTDSQETTILTDTTYNNTEPVAYGDVTLWQAWIGNNWEIIMLEGDQKITQLTDNSLQDVSPHMRADYIVWQTQFADGWKVALYDKNTQTTHHIESEDGLQVENPRFVLVYDSTNNVGDVQTLGYDFDNKKSFTLSSIPKDIPDELPEPDQTGETRALIQNKQTAKEGEVEIIDIEDSVATSTQATSTPTNQEGNVDLTEDSSTSTESVSTTTVTAVEDVIIPNYRAGGTESQPQNGIKDIVIPPHNSTTTSEMR